MRKVVSICLLLALETGCGARRMAGWAPHRPDIAEHGNITANSACLDCHEVDRLKGHSRGEDCLSCHKVIQGR